MFMRRMTAAAAGLFLGLSAGIASGQAMADLAAGGGHVGAAARGARSVKVPARGERDNGRAAADGGPATTPAAGAVVTADAAGQTGDAAPLTSVSHRAHPTVVVELYTSQGCSSCPPADEMLAELVGRKGIIPLALHVNYWDYIGWTDKFGSQAFTDRQKAYALAIGSRTIYTPQLIIDGDDRVAGARPLDVAELIQEHAADPSPVELTLTRSGKAVTIAAQSDRTFGQQLMVQLVRYLPEKTVTILRGENAGQTITYHNIVTSWKVIGSWDGAVPLSLQAEAEGSEPVAVILQEPGPGSVLAAASLE